MRMPEHARPAHAGIVLAAGQSRRLGTPKPLVRIDGEPLLQRSVRLLLETSPDEVIVVVGEDNEALVDLLRGLDCRSVVCSDAALGMSATLRCGLAAVDPACAGALVVLTDQPALDAAHLRSMVARWRIDPGRAVASGYADTIGVPALLPRSWFDAVRAGTADRGARELLRSRRAQVDVINAESLAFDLDSPDDLSRWQAARNSSN